MIVDYMFGIVSYVVFLVKLLMCEVTNYASLLVECMEPYRKEKDVLPSKSEIVSGVHNL